MSLRTRLTLMILVSTAAVSVVAVLLGMKILRDNVRDAAIEDRSQSNLVEVIAIELDQSVELEGEVAVVVEAETAGESVSIDGDPGVSVVPELAEFETDVVLDRLDQFDLYSSLVERFPNRSESITLLLSTGETLVVDQAGIAGDQTSGNSQIVVDAASITGIGGSVFETSNATANDSELAYGSTTAADGRTIGFVVDLTEGYRALEEVATLLWLGAAMLTAMAAAGAWLLVGRSLAPVDSITQRVSEITAQGLGERVPVSMRGDEIGTLATTMNSMLGRLESSDRQRRQFISDASHELRTPVAVLQSEAEVARRAPDSTSLDALSQVVLDESHRLGGLVEDLLSIARGDETDQSLDASRQVDVDEVVLAESQRTRRVPINRVGVSAGRIIGQADGVERAVRHLLDNAARHAEKQVAVGVKTQANEVVCWVDDDGPGIAEADRGRVFERFVRLDAARDRDRGGAGLGLAVVKSSIEAMNGTVAVSKAPLGGARFEIRWPNAD